MALPQLSVKTFEVRQPSTGDKLTLRPFLVSEEKILLQASENTEYMVPAMKQVLSNCIQGTPIDIDSLPAFDIEYIFLQLRSESVGSIVTLMLEHKEGCERTEVQVNLREIKVVMPEEKNDEIMLDKKVGIRMKYPTMEMMGKFADLDEDAGPEASFEMLRMCIDAVYTTDGEVHEANKIDPQELEQFVDSMNTEQFMKVQQFFETMPAVKHVIKVPKCETCGQAFEQEVVGMQSFF